MSLDIGNNPIYADKQDIFFLNYSVFNNSIGGTRGTAVCSWKKINGNWRCNPITNQG